MSHDSDRWAQLFAIAIQSAHNQRAPDLKMVGLGNGREGERENKNKTQLFIINLNIMKFDFTTIANIN